MTFDEIHADIDCTCIDDECCVNTWDEFVHGVCGPELDEGLDFRTQWERNKRKGPHGTQPSCYDICLRKGVSTDKVEENLDGILERYRTTVLISRRLFPKRTHYCVFRCKSGAGAFRPTPSSRGPSHHTFYKADGFTFDKIEVISINPIDP